MSNIQSEIREAVREEVTRLLGSTASASSSPSSVGTCELRRETSDSERSSGASSRDLVILEFDIMILAPPAARLAALYHSRSFTNYARANVNKAVSLQRQKRKRKTLHQQVVRKNQLTSI